MLLIQMHLWLRGRCLSYQGRRLDRVQSRCGCRKCWQQLRYYRSRQLLLRLYRCHCGITKTIVAIAIAVADRIVNRECIVRRSCISGIRWNGRKVTIEIIDFHRLSLHSILRHHSIVIIRIHCHRYCLKLGFVIAVIYE